MLAVLYSLQSIRVSKVLLKNFYGDHTTTVQGNNVIGTLLKISRSILLSSSLVRARFAKVPAEDIVFQESGNAGVIILNRPKRRNAVTLSMIHATTRQIEEFEKFKKVIITKSAVPKIFCAGGDVFEVLEKFRAGDQTTMYNCRYGYQLIHTIATARVPYIVLADGLTMGGGAGISVLAKYCICTENTLFAMPEAKIGLFCDVGSSYFLPRLKNHVGFFLALTGRSVRGCDNVHVGTATHFCESAKLPELEKALATTNDIEGALNAICKKPENSTYFLEPRIDKIDRIFRLRSVEEIISKLEEDGSPWAKKTAGIIRYMCPLALKAILHNLHQSKNRSLEECLQNEYVLAHSFFRGENFKEGFRAALIERDLKPRWVPARLEDVTSQMITDLYKVPPFLGPLELRPSFTKSKI